MKTAVALFTLLLCAAAAQAQTVWRCGAEGRSYTDSPCPEGRMVLAADARNADDVQAARDVLTRDRALARDLVQQRHEREREARAGGSGLAGIKPEPKPDIKPKVAKKKAKRQAHEAPSATGFVARGTSPKAVPASR